MNQPKDSPDDQVETSNPNIDIFESLFSKEDYSRCEISFNFTISNNQNIDFTDMAFNILCIQSSKNVQNIMMNFVYILYQFTSLCLFTKIPEKYFRLKRMVSHSWLQLDYR